MAPSRARFEALKSRDIHTYASTVPHIPVDDEELAAFCERHGIRKLALFGSVLREDFTPESDVDVLVEFDEEAIPGFFRLMDIRRELEELLGVEEVDLRTPEDLSPHFREDVLESAEVQYARA